MKNCLSPVLTYRIWCPHNLINSAADSSEMVFLPTPSEHREQIIEMWVASVRIFVKFAKEQVPESDDT